VQGSLSPVALRASTRFPAAGSNSLPSRQAPASSHTVPCASRPCVRATRTGAGSSVMAVAERNSAAAKTLASPRSRSPEPRRLAHIAKSLISSRVSSCAILSQSAVSTSLRAGCAATPALLPQAPPASSSIPYRPRGREERLVVPLAKWLKHMASSTQIGLTVTACSVTAQRLSRCPSADRPH
jgi:hypothetical protein